MSLPTILFSDIHSDPTSSKALKESLARLRSLGYHKLLIEAPSNLGFKDLMNLLDSSVENRRMLQAEILPKVRRYLTKTPEGIALSLKYKVDTSLPLQNWSAQAVCIALNSLNINSAEIAQSIVCLHPFEIFVNAVKTALKLGFTVQGIDLPAVLMVQFSEAINHIDQDFLDLNHRRDKHLVEMVTSNTEPDTGGTIAFLGAAHITDLQSHIKCHALETDYLTAFICSKSTYEDLDMIRHALPKHTDVFQKPSTNLEIKKSVEVLVNAVKKRMMEAPSSKAFAVVEGCKAGKPHKVLAEVRPLPFGVTTSSRLGSNVVGCLLDSLTVTGALLRQDSYLDLQIDPPTATEITFLARTKLDWSLSPDGKRAMVFHINDPSIATRIAEVAKEIDAEKDIVLRQ